MDQDFFFQSFGFLFSFFCFPHCSVCGISQTTYGGRPIRIARDHLCILDNKNFIRQTELWLMRRKHLMQGRQAKERSVSLCMFNMRPFRGGSHDDGYEILMVARISRRHGGRQSIGLYEPRINLIPLM